MTAEADDHVRSMALAEVALGQIKALRQSAQPRNYEVWYNYAAGFHPAVNQLINGLIAKDGQISQTDLDRIYETYFSAVRHPEQIDSAASKFKEQIDKVMAMIEQAAGTATRHSESLADVNSRLGAADDRDALRAIVESLAHTAKEMEESNRSLEQRLNTSKQEITELHAHLDAVRSESLTDPLTSLANRKYFDTAIAQALAAADKAGEPLSLLLADIDHFKNFNDTYGHLIGDQVLRLVAMALKDNAKGRDLAARYGGEEFAVVLPETPLRQATTVAEHMRRAVMGKELLKRSTGEHLGRITMSIGVATLHAGESAGSLIERADKCLYAAKRNGRNRVICEVDPEVAAAGAAPAAQAQVA